MPFDIPVLTHQTSGEVRLVQKTGRDPLAPNVIYLP